jgi:hypothetical protein
MAAHPSTFCLPLAHTGGGRGAGPGEGAYALPQGMSGGRNDSSAFADPRVATVAGSPAPGHRNSPPVKGVASLAGPPSMPQVCGFTVSRPLLGELEGCSARAKVDNVVVVRDAPQVSESTMVRLKHFYTAFIYLIAINVVRPRRPHQPSTFVHHNQSVRHAALTCLWPRYQHTLWANVNDASSPSPPHTDTNVIYDASGGGVRVDVLPRAVRLAGGHHAPAEATPRQWRTHGHAGSRRQQQL